MALRGGMPKLVVIAEFTGDDEADVKQRAHDALAALKKRRINARLTRDEEESHKYWTIRRSSFNVIRSVTRRGSVRHRSLTTLSSGRSTCPNFCRSSTRCSNRTISF